MALSIFALAATPSCDSNFYLPIDEAIVVKVLVLNFDPIIAQENSNRLHEVRGWQVPRELTAEYIRDMMDATQGLIHYELVDWRDINAFPALLDGFIYTADEYLSCLAQGTGWHEPHEADYEKIFADYGVIPRINSGEIDELWLFGAPYFGYFESAMAGPGAFFINGAVYDRVESERAFAIMGYNYERGVAEMLHNLGHRTESTLSRIYGGWAVARLDTNWARFAANAHQSNGEAGVGTCHYPANGESDYDYANPRFVSSSAEDWLNYPAMTGTKTMVSCENWGGPDYQRNYLKWFFAHLPKAPGINDDGRLNNWWEYIFRFNAYDELGHFIE